MSTCPNSIEESSGEAGRRGTYRRGSRRFRPMASRGVAFALVALCLLVLALRGAGKRLVPALFVFGDSTVDVGNNNHLPNCSVECKANYPRYGVDYPFYSPTGRFSNGYNLADQIARFLGFPESPPAFQSLPDERIIPQMKSGINFASGGSGLLDATGGQKCTQVYTMADQLEKFSSVVRAMGNCSTRGCISRSLVFISAGSNDLLEYADEAPSAFSRNDTVFLQRLVASYRNHLKELYGAGARKFSIVSPSLVGCCPSQRVVAQEKKDVDRLNCFGTANALSRQLYVMLDSMLKALSLDLAGMNYSLGDSVGMAESVLNGTVPPMNLTVVDTACCGGTGPSAGRELRCNLSASLCPNRANYLFWDGFHPTDAASAVAAWALFNGPRSFVHPINVEELAALRP